MASRSIYKRYLEPNEPYNLPASTRRRKQGKKSLPEQSGLAGHEAPAEIETDSITSSLHSTSGTDDSQTHDQEWVAGDLVGNDSFSESGSDGPSPYQSDDPESGSDGPSPYQSDDPESGSNGPSPYQSDDPESGSDGPSPYQSDDPGDDEEDLAGGDGQGMFDRDPVLEEPLFPGIRTTKAEAILMILTYAMRFQLSSAALIELLKLFNKVLAMPVLAATRHLFRKIFRNRLTNLSFHFYCEYCMSLVCTIYEYGNDAIPCPNCTRPCSVKNLSGENFFITSALAPQLRMLLEDPDIVPHFNYREERVKDANNNLEDIYDGEYYQSLSAAGQPLSDPLNFSYTFNSDGTPIYRSSKFSLWPIYVMINELPPKLRKENLLLAGLWFGKHEPKMDLFLEKFVDGAKGLSEEGVSWTRDGVELNSKFYGLCCCVDAPARAAMQNTLQYNGYYGCSLCYHPGRLVERVVKYPVDVCEYSDRSDEEVIRDMITACNDHRTVRGIKGPTPLINLPYFPIVWGLPPDYMHCVLLGVARQLGELWFSAPATSEFYIGQPNKLSCINGRLKSVECPSIIHRLPRPVEERKYWKASEWFNWLLFFSLPCLQGLLGDAYIRHLYRLVEGVFLLLKKSVSRESINQADHLLFQFVAEVQVLYGASAMTFNVHSLTHLAKSVAMWGPLWTHSCFPFEAANGKVKNMLHGNKGMALQAMQKFLLYRALPSFSQVYNVSRQATRYCLSILEGKKPKSTAVLGDIELLGSGTYENLTDAESEVLADIEYADVDEVLVYGRIRKQGLYYSSKDYTRYTRVCNRYFLHSDGSGGEIKKIVVHEGQCLVFYSSLVLDAELPFYDNEFDIKVSHIRKCSGDGPLCITNSSELVGCCIHIQIGNARYICSFPNFCGLD